jgi:hypothetical protein
MTRIKHRLAKLEASASWPAEEQVTEIHRVIVCKTNPDGSPYVIVRRLSASQVPHGL